jgi:hypothetical protein
MKILKFCSLPTLLIAGTFLPFNSTTVKAQESSQPQPANSSPDHKRQEPMSAISKTEFEILEGKFHDGLGTYAELSLANALIEEAQITQSRFDLRRSREKMLGAISRLPESHFGRALFQKEMLNIEEAARKGAAELLKDIPGAKLKQVRHVAGDFANAKASDLLLEFESHPVMPVSVKTDKSGRVAIAEGQTPDIGLKWAERYFRVSDAELNTLIKDLGFNSMSELKGYYLNMARLVAEVMIRKLALKEYELNDFSRAKTGSLDSAKYLFRQLLHFKKGNDGSRVIIFDRKTGQVKWDSLLESVDIESLTSDRISFTPARPRHGRHIGTTFGIRIDGRTVVTFQVKHKRGKARGSANQYEFSDITTRLEIKRN